MCNDADRIAAAAARANDVVDAFTDRVHAAMANVAAGVTQSHHEQVRVCTCARLDGSCEVHHPAQQPAAERPQERPQRAVALPADTPTEQYRIRYRLRRVPDGEEASLYDLGFGQHADLERWRDTVDTLHESGFDARLERRWLTHRVQVVDDWRAVEDPS